MVYNEALSPDYWDPEELKLLIKSIIVSKKGGMPPDDLRDEFFRITGEHMPSVLPQSRSLFHFLHTIEGLYFMRTEDGRCVMNIRSAKTEHLQELIKNQRDARPPRKRPAVPKTAVYYQRTPHRVTFAEKELSEDEGSECSSTSGITSESENFSLIEKRSPPTIPIDPYYDERKRNVFEPVFGDQQLIGDDFFLQLCIKYQNNPRLVREHSKAAISCGTVRSGDTIQKATARLKNISNMSNKLTICLGAVDVYTGYSIEKMKRDMDNLLNVLEYDYSYKTSDITLCTIPPLANVTRNIQTDCYRRRLAFNKWIKDICFDYGYKLLDFGREFLKDRIIDFNLFQRDARMVSGTRHPHVLWNWFGRQKALRMITGLYSSSFDYS